MHDRSLQPLNISRRGLIAGLMLCVATVLEIVAMSHHPSVNSHDAAQVVRQIDAMAELANWVHGTLLALMLIVAFGFSEFVLRRDPRRPLIRAGSIAYAAGVIVMLGAAMVSGFIIPGFSAHTPHATTVDLQINAQLLVLCAVLNQTWAKFGAISMSAGIGLWSIDLLRDAGVPRMIGVLGVLTSAAPLMAIPFGVMRLDVPGMTTVILLQAAWNIAVGLSMARSRI
jgi:hypothetical protein